MNVKVQVELKLIGRVYTKMCFSYLICKVFLLTCVFFSTSYAKMLKNDEEV